MKSSLTALRDALRAFRDALRTTPTPPTPPPPSDDHPYDDRIFNDPLPLNPGDISFSKRPEEITKADVVNALSLPDLFEGIPVINQTWDEMLDNSDFARYTDPANPAPFIWTARGAKLIAPSAKPEYVGVDSTAYNTLYNEQLDWWREYNPSSTGKDITTKKIAYYNAQRLKDIENAHVAIDKNTTGNHPNCVGLKLDKVYPVLYEGSVSLRSPSTYLARCFRPRRDFLIDGEVDKKAVGGFVSRYGLLATTCSLVLRKARFQRKDEQSYKTIYVDCEEGIEQLQITDCVFEQAAPDSDNINTRNGHGFAANYVYIYTKDSSPWTDATRSQLVNDNCIRHALIQGNTVYGTKFIDSDMVRFVNSYRAIDNTFFLGHAEENLDAGRPRHLIRGETGSCISHTNLNGASYANKISYHSCPMFFVGNKFLGPERAIAKRVTWSTSNEAIGLEMAQAYFIGNTFRNLIVKQTLFDGGRYAEFHFRCHANYESYMSVTKLWFVNNALENIAWFTHMNSDSRGIFKGKGTGIPYDFRPGWNFANPIRYFVGNTVTLDKNTIWNSWLDCTGQTERYVKGRKYDPYDPFTTYGISVGNNWKPSEWLIEDKYGDFPPMHVPIAKTCRTCGKALARDATECDNTECEDYGGTPHISTTYPSDKFPWLIGERHYDQVFQKGLDENLEPIENVDPDGIDHDFKNNIVLYFNEIIQGYKEKYNNIIAPVYTYVFERNVIDLGDFCLGGMADSSSINTCNFICRNNIFKARRMASVYTEDNTRKVLYTARRWMKDNISDPDKEEFIFNIVPNDFYKATYETYNGTPSIEEIANDPTLELHNNNTILVRRPVRATVDISNNQFIVDDFVKDDAVVPTEVNFLRVKYDYTPPMYQNKGITINKVGLPATVVISGNTIATPTDPDNSQQSLIRFRTYKLSNGSYGNLTPTNP